MRHTLAATAAIVGTIGSLLCAADPTPETPAPATSAPATAAQPASRPATTTAAAPFDEFAAAEALAARVREVARDLPWLDVDDVLYDRDAPTSPARGGDRLAAGLARLPPCRPFGWRPTTLPSLPDPSSAAFPLTIGLAEPLLHDDDARVRTLALLLLARTGRLDALPLIATRLDDSYDAFPAPRDPLQLTAAEAARWQADQAAFPLDRQTVADVAQRIVDWYWARSPALRNAKDRPTSLDVSYATQRVAVTIAGRDREAGAWAVRIALARANAGLTDEPPPDRAARYDALARAVWTLPDPQRFFALLALRCERRPPPSLPADAMDRAAAAVPTSIRYEMCDAPARTRAFVSRDFDLPAEWGQRFFVDRAARYLGPLPVPESRYSLYAISGWGQLDVESVAYALIDARLRADGLPRADAPLAAPRLRDAIQRFDGRQDGETRGRLAAEMVVLGGDDGLNDAVDWCFAEPAERRRLPGVRATFLADVLARRPDRFWPLARRLVDDPRFDTLGAQSLRVLVDAAAARTGRPIAADAERSAAYGVAEFEAGFAPLARWRDLLKQSADGWSDPPPGRPPLDPVLKGHP